MSTVLYHRDGRIGWVTLNGLDLLNVIDDRLPEDLATAIRSANANPDVHVIVRSGADRAFCAGCDLAHYAEATEGAGAELRQDMPRDPIKDFVFMKRNTDLFMEIFGSLKPVICRVPRFAVAGGSDIALCAHLVIMAENAEIGHMPARGWECPAKVMWVCRLGSECAKHVLLSHDRIDGRKAEWLGVVLKAVPANDLDAEFERSTQRMVTVPVNQLAMQNMLIKRALENMRLASTQTLATIFDGITRHSPEGLNPKACAKAVGRKLASAERDRGTYDWTRDRPVNPEVYLVHCFTPWFAAAGTFCQTAGAGMRRGRWPET